MKSAILAMSGGVYSSTIAKDMVVNFQLLNESFADETVIQRHQANRDGAKRVSYLLGILFIVKDISDKFYKCVMKPFVRSYTSGFSPNPCVFRNPLIKVRVLREVSNGLGEIIMLRVTTRA